jgi:UDP-N-acetylglucosamine 2-epimerase
MEKQFEKPKLNAKEGEDVQDAINKEADKNEDNKEILEKPTTSDPTASLIYIQGHPLFHLACGIMYFQVDQSNDPLTCYKIDKSSYPWHFTTTVQSTQLNSNFQTLTYIHLACFILLSLVNIIDSIDLNAHYSTILSLITVPLYQYTILHS